MRTRYRTVTPSQTDDVLKTRFGIAEILNRFFQRLWLFHFQISLNPRRARVTI